MKSTRTNSTKVETTPFTLVLPDDIDIKPKWSVPVSKTYTAHVYEQTVNIYTEDKATVARTDTHYKIVVTHNVSGNVRSDDYNRYNGDHYASVLDVKLALGRIGRSLAPKKTTRVETEDEE